MVATVDIVRKTGPSGAIVVSVITAINTRANAYDGHSTGDTANPIQKPASGYNYSYWVSTRLKAQTTPIGTINNLRYFTDGVNGFGTGVTCKAAKASIIPDAGYRQATGTPGVTGTELTVLNHPGLDSAPVDIFTYVAGAPLALVGSIVNPNVGEFGDHVVYQVAIDTTVSPGPTATENFTFRYDET